MTRDLTKKQFEQACIRWGFQPRNFMGYYAIGDGVEVSALNAGNRRRDQLAYLIRMRRGAKPRKLSDILRDMDAAEARGEPYIPGESPGA